jgi:L-phenylalanine/L-methionine N-acetyltransferase
MARGEIVIRAQEPEDVEAIAEISNCPGVVAGTLQLPLRSVAERRQRFAQLPEGVHRLVAEVDGKVVGMLGLHTEINPRRRHCGSIGMGVHDHFQGQGVGSALLAAAIDLADNWLGLRRLELHVYVDNAAGTHLYEKFGFVVEGTARDFAFRDGVFVDALAMARLRPESGDHPAGQPLSTVVADTPEQRTV